MKNKKLWFESYRKFLEKCLKEKLTPSEEFIIEWYNIQEECLRKLMKLTVNFCVATINETKKQVREIDSKLKSTLPNPEYKTVRKQIIINEE